MVLQDITDLDNQDTLTIRMLTNSPKVSIIHMQVPLYSSQQHHGHSTELMRITFSNRSTWQHNFKCNSQQNIMHNCMYVYSVYHMNDMWMASVITTQYKLLAIQHSYNSQLLYPQLIIYCKNAHSKSHMKILSK